MTDLLSLLLLRYEALIIGSTMLSTPCTFAVPWLQDKPTQFPTFCPLKLSPSHPNYSVSLSRWPCCPALPRPLQPPLCASSSIIPSPGLHTASTGGQGQQQLSGWQDKELKQAKQKLQKKNGYAINQILEGRKVCYIEESKSGTGCI